jgi:2-aminoadipate transaminase
MWTDTRPTIEMPQLFELGGDLISFAGGLPDLTRLPLGDIAGQLSRIVRLGGRTVFQYSTPHVAANLVPAISDLMEREAIHERAEDLVPTSGSQMGLMAVALGLASPGEAVLCQTPAYPGATAAFRAAGLGLRAVAGDDDGLDPENLREAVRQVRAVGGVVRLLYCNPTFQNPTGTTMSVRRREEILGVCRELDLLMIEDNPYGLLAFDGTYVPACKSIDPDQVVYLGTFSKIFAPGLRCGWIAAPAHVAPALRRTAEVLALSPSAFAQSALAAFHSANGWSGLIASYQESYRDRCALMTGVLQQALGTDGIWTWRQPGGGFYLWLRHSGGVDTNHYLAAAAENGVSFVPGRHFSIDGEHADGLRVCFSYAPTKRIAEGVSRLARALTTPVDHDGDRAGDRTERVFA